MITKNTNSVLMEKTFTYESDEALMKDLRNGYPPAFEALYRKYYRMIARQVAESGRTNIEAEDLFQEVLVVLVRKVRDPGFELSAKLSTYLFAISRNLLLKSSGKLSDTALRDNMLSHLTDRQSSDELNDMQLREEQLNVIVGHLQLLEDDCQQILTLSFYEKQSQAEIARIMGYSDAFVKVKKYRCLEYLRKQVKNHPLFKRLQ